MFKLKLYQRYLMRESFAAIFLVLAAFLALFAFFDLINELRNIGKGGYQLKHALLYVVLSIPGTVYELIPIAALIGSLYALTTLARHSELTVLRASGLSTRSLLTTLFRVAGLLALLTLLVGELLVPVSERLAQELWAKAMSKVISQSGFQSGLWIKDGHSFINIREATLDAKLNGVRIYKFTHGNVLESVTDVDRAEYQPPDHWRLTGVIRTTLDGDSASVQRIDSEEWRSAITPDLLSVLMVLPERMSLLGLLSYTEHLNDNHQKSERYEVAVWKKIIYPLATLVMVALALPFGYSHNRMGGASLKVFSGVMLGILFYMLNGLFSNLGAINSWPPFASASAPSAMFFLVAMGMLWWVERR
jgi:lipopolysaccharide export system permease protein